jgi:hypothetical protein
MAGFRFLIQASSTAVLAPYPCLIRLSLSPAVGPPGTTQRTAFHGPDDDGGPFMYWIIDIVFGYKKGKIYK